MYFTHPQFNKLKLFSKKISEAKLKERLAKFFPNKEIIFTDLGRSGFQLAIKNLNLQNSEMLVPAYICDVFLPIFENFNIKPIYLDIDLKTFHIKTSEIEKNITPKTKSILVCHTYGLSVEMTKILEIAKKHNLKVIEDCAHIFPIKISGHCAFFSFSKLFPSIDGGMLVCKKPIKTSLKQYKSQLTNLIKSARLFPSLANVSESFRRSIETLSSNKFSIPGKASEQSLRILNWYLNNLKSQISKRTKLAKYFQDNLQQLGFQVSTGTTYISALVPKNINRDKLFNNLRKKKIFCSRIWHKPIFPNSPNTSEASKRIINFPFQAWFTKKDIDKIVKITNDILQNND